MASFDWFAPGSLTFEIVKTLPTVAVVAVTGFLAWVVGNGQKNIADAQRTISDEQRRIARAKLNLDLFEKRYEIFMAVWEELSSVLQGKKQTKTLASPLGNILPRARFLFGDDIGDYLSEVNSKFADLGMIEAETEGNGNTLPSEHIQTRRDLMNWIGTEAISGAKRRFGQYLDFGEWR